MRAVASFLLLLASCLLPASALGDAMDQISVIGGGQDIEFALPAATTVPDALFGGSYRFPSVPGTVNEAPTTVSAYFIFPGFCAVCDTIQLTTINGNDYNSLSLGLPNLYAITSPDLYDVTLSLLPGSYASVDTYPFGSSSYTIDISPQASANTPEPPTLLLLATATLGLVALPLRRRRLCPK